MISGAHQLDNEMSSADTAARRCDKSHYNANMYGASLGAAGGAQTQNESRQETLGGGETIVQSISRQGEEDERAAASCCVGVMMQYVQPRRSFEAVKACGSVITFYPTRSDASPPPAAPPAAPPRRLFWGVKA